MPAMPLPDRIALYDRFVARWLASLARLKIVQAAPLPITPRAKVSDPSVPYGATAIGASRD